MPFQMSFEYASEESSLMFIGMSFQALIPEY